MGRKIKMIKIEKRGIVKKCRKLLGFKEWYIYIQDDEKDSGGYLIFYENPKNKKEAYDDWVENKEKLEEYFEMEKLEVEWEK